VSASVTATHSSGRGGVRSRNGATNTRLRSGLDSLVADPYGLGWLFTARGDGGHGGLRHGRAAREWMASEVARLSSVVHEHLLHPRSGGGLPADGGRPAPGFLRHLGREDVLRLFAAFFPLPVETRRAP